MEGNTVSKFILLFCVVYASMAQAEKIKITRASNIGEARVDLLIREKQQLTMNGTELPVSMNHLAGPSYRTLKPKKLIARTIRRPRCYGGYYIVESETRKEMGCLEDGRAGDIAEAIAKLRKIAVLANTIQ